MGKIIDYPVSANPETERPTHHISLSDGINTLGIIAVDSEGNANPLAISRGTVPRTAMKTTSGNESYASFEPPWSPIVQADWSGGRANLEFERDTTSFMDDYQVNTLFGNIYNAPQEQFSTGYRSATGNLPGSVSWSALIPGTRQYLGYQLLMGGSGFTAAEITLWVKRRGTPAADMSVELCSNTAGAPGTVLASATITTAGITDTISRRYRVTFTGVALSAATYYWVKVYSNSGTDTDCWLVGVKAGVGSTWESSDGTTWSASAVDLYYRIADAAGAYKTIFFTYRYALYMIRQLASGAPRLYINGDRGAADSNSGDLNYLNDATKTWTTDQYKNCKAKIFEGTGLVDDSSEREITANGAAALTVSPAWLAAHGTDTGYAIIGSDAWTEITGHGITVPVTDVLVVNNICYFALGDDTNIRRMREYNNAGVWTREYADDGTNKAFKLATVRDATNGLEIWRGNNKDGTGLISVSKAAVVAWGTNLTFGTAITLQDDSGKINRITEYGDTTKQLYIMREGMLGNITGGKYDEIELKEIKTMADSSNGKVVLRHNVYLYFNLGMRLERYYDRNLEDVGANRNEGLPDDRNGTISAGIGLPGLIVISIDGGNSNYSSALTNLPGGGYCEIYRGMMPGDRIFDMAYQVIPGTAIDRIWIAVGGDIIYLPFSIDRPRNGINTFTHESVMVSSYIHAGYYDIYKFVHTLKIFAESLEDDVCWIEADYQVEDETTWHPLPGVFNASNTESQLTSEIGVNGKRIRYRLRMQTADNSKSPRVKSTVLDSIARVPLTYSYSFQYRVMDNDINLLGEHDPITSKEKQEILDRWAVQLTPLRMHSTRKLFDNKIVFIDPSPASPRAERLEKYIETLTVMEVRPEEGAA